MRRRAPSEGAQTDPEQPPTTATNHPEGPAIERFLDNSMGEIWKRKALISAVHEMGLPKSLRTRLPVGPGYETYMEQQLGLQRVP